MIPAAFDYVAPRTVSEAVDLLRQYGYDAKVIAGGQSLIPMMRFRMAQPRVLVDIGKIAELDYLKEEDGYLRIGALVRHSTMEFSPLIQERYPLLAATARVVADPIVRNRGTVVGSVVHADPGGDWAAALMAARAEVVVVGLNGQRVIKIDDFLIDTFTTALEPEELAVEVRVPIPGPRTGGDYQKIERKVGDFATAAVAVQIQLDERGVCQSAGIGLCAVGPITLRAAEAEAALVGKPLDEASIRVAAGLAAEIARPVADLRGSVEYKKDMVRVLVGRALRRAAEWARKAQA